MFLDSKLEDKRLHRMAARIPSLYLILMSSWMEFWQLYFRLSFNTDFVSSVFNFWTRKFLSALCNTYIQHFKVKSNTVLPPPANHHRHFKRPKVTPVRSVIAMVMSNFSCHVIYTCHFAEISRDADRKNMCRKVTSSRYTHTHTHLCHIWTQNQYNKHVRRLQGILIQGLLTRSALEENRGLRLGYLVRLVLLNRERREGVLAAKW